MDSAPDPYEVFRDNPALIEPVVEFMNGLRVEHQSIDRAMAMSRKEGIPLDQAALVCHRLSSHLNIIIAEIEKTEKPEE